MKPVRLLVVLVSLVASVVVIGPAHGATNGSSQGDTSGCVLMGSQANAQRAVFTPISPIEEDGAYNLTDPDASDAHLELIRFPDENSLWVEVGGPSLAGSPTAGLEGTGPEARAAAFTGPDRQDSDVSDSIVRLYCGLFGRQPNPFELEYWAGRYWNGLPLVTIAEAFTHAQEFVHRHGIVTDAELVAILYSDVLGRQSSAGGSEALVAELDSGVIHRGQAVVQFTESGEYVAKTGTTAPVKPPLPYPDVGSGRRIVMTDSGQRVWLISGTGELHKTHQISGRRGVPGVGRYNVYSMSRYAFAPYDGITMEYMVRFARGEWPYGFHSIPVWPGDDPLQVPAQLGTHRSGGCVRQLWDDAEAVFDWAEIGDRVIIIT